MPGFDQTGPRGDGPLSGKGQGNCATARAGRMQGWCDGYGQGRDRGRGRGFRRGMGNRCGRRAGVGPQWNVSRNDDVKE